MNRKKSTPRRSMITAITVMLVLCILAAIFIVTTVRHRAESKKTAKETVEETAPAPESTAADEGLKERMSHVYANSGASSDEKYTLAAFDGAVAAGASCLALPVVASADGTPYVAGDDDLHDLAGMNAYISGMTDSQLSEIRTNGGNAMLKLSDVFEKYGRNVSYVIEIKYTDDSNISAFADAVKKHELGDIVSVSSSYYVALEKAAGDFPDMPKVFLCANEEDFSAALGIGYIDTISVEKSMMTDEKLAKVHESSKKFGAWTLNSEEEINKALDMGVDSYYTDEAAVAASAEKAR